MKGRPNNPTVARAKARAHAKRSYACTCGKTVRGNGARASHRSMHARRGDGHRIILVNPAFSAQYGLHCLRPDTCNPDKGKEGCVCDCTGCRFTKHSTATLEIR